MVSLHIVYLLVGVVVIVGAQDDPTIDEYLDSLASFDELKVFTQKAVDAVPALLEAESGWWKDTVEYYRADVAVTLDKYQGYYDSSKIQCVVRKWDYGREMKRAEKYFERQAQLNGADYLDDKFARERQRLADNVEAIDARQKEAEEKPNKADKLLSAARDDTKKAYNGYFPKVQQALDDDAEKMRLRTRKYNGDLDAKGTELMKCNL